MLKPAELNVGQVKKIAVMDFEFTGSWDFAESVGSPQTLKQFGQVFLKKLIEEQDKLDPVTAYPGRNVSDRLIAKLVNNGYYTVIEREQISKVLNEQALALSGLIDESQAAEVGRLVGAEGLVMGIGSYSVKDKGKWETYKEKKVEKKRYRVYRHVTTTITFKIVNVSTGTIVVSKTNSLSNSRGSGIASKHSSTGKDEKAALNAVPDWRPIVDDLVNKITNQTLRQIAPHYVTEKRDIEEGDSAPMEAAVEYAKRNLWEDAKELWDSVLQDPRAEKEDQISASYNIGLYFEIHGYLDQAEDYYKQTFNMSGDSKYLDARARIDRRRKELQRLNQQQI
jgi:curli biogenesis system outer membrane secretion channel CsgG